MQLLYFDMPEIEAIIFDWGGVLIEFPPPKVYEYCAKALGVPFDRFRRAAEKFDRDFQRGSITEDIFWKLVCKGVDAGKPKSKSLWKEAFGYAYEPRKDVFSVASSLHRRGYKVGFLSNTEAPAAEFFLEQKYGFFDAAVFSCHEGIRKPDRRIYEILLERLGVKPEQAVLVDDREENLDGARLVGMRTLLFKNPDQMTMELGLIGVKIR